MLGGGYILMETLKDLRIQSKKTCAEVAKELGVSAQAITNYESGIRRINIEQVITLAKLYDVSEKEVIQAQLNSCQSSQ